MNEKTKKALENVVDYLFDDEEKHYEELLEETSEDNSERRTHIFNDLKVLKEYLKVAGKKQSLEIPITADEAEELLNGGEYNWTFPTEESGEQIDVHVHFDDGVEDEYEPEQ